MTKNNKKIFDKEKELNDSHYFDDEYNYDTSFFKNKSFKKFLIITFSIVILILIASFIFEGRDVNIIRISNYYFVIGIIVLILSVMVRIFAWSVHKKSVLKRHDDNEKDMILAKGTLRLTTKVLSFIAFVCLLISLILTIIMILTL